jgi:Eukaryotic aspartyl protease
MPFYPDGMWGMAYRALESIGQPTAFEDLHLQANVPDLFSIQLDAVGGLLTLGGKLRDDSQYAYTPLVKEDFYRVQVADVRLGQHSLGLSPDYYAGTNCIVDSGTPFPTLPAEAYLALRQLALQTCTSAHPLVGVCVDEAGAPLAANQTLFDGQCFSLTPAQVAEFAPLQFVLGGQVTLSLPASDYLLPMYYCVTPGQVGLGITVEAHWTIVGALSMRPYETVFDRAQSRLGFRLR